MRNGRRLEIKTLVWAEDLGRPLGAYLTDSDGTEYSASFGALFDGMLRQELDSVYTPEGRRVRALCINGVRYLNAVDLRPEMLLPGVAIVRE